MRNWVIKLLSLLIFPALLGVVFTWSVGSGLKDWVHVLTYILAPLVTAALSAWTVRSRWQFPFLFFMVAASIIFTVPLQNWLFHSADEIRHYASVTDLYEEASPALYFTFDTLDADRNRRSSVTITREVTRKVGRHRYQRESKRYVYTVVPVFEDSLPAYKGRDREVKAWLIPVKHEKGQSVICYERCTFGLDDYQKAIDKSQCRLHHPQAPVIRPLYKAFITRQEWRRIFLNASWAVVSVLMLAGIIINYRLR